MPANYSTQPLPLSTPGRNLLRLTLVRGITWTGFLGGIIFGLEVLNFQLQVVAVFSVILAMALVNLLTWWRLSWPGPVTDTEYLLHLLADLLGLSLLFYFTGGANNPFISYFLVPLTISAATLPWRSTWIIAAYILFAYPLLMLFHQPVPQLEHLAETSELNVHLLGRWANFVLSTSLISVFIFKMAQSLRQRDADLSQTREHSLRDEQIIAVATQAAGTAHELGTPLSTMAVILKELSNEYTSDKELSADLDLLRKQVDTCKVTLQSLVSNADRSRLLNPDCKPLKCFLKQLLEHWEVLRPDVRYCIDWSDNSQDEPRICNDITLQQALINLLNNAADASDEPVTIVIDWTKQEAQIDIHDQGPGIPMEIAERLGQTFLSTKSKGLGLGLFLTHATINRLGGTVHLYNHKHGGTLTEVRFPVKATVAKKSVAAKN
ncbi:ATP-binding protein [Marinospirillum insulare]|uniref:histidine kinase n=1 Tax=Marinospirillum insulare TaxID=217169 RepID=A0ABQ6A581_9GAMM|nr:ATP-binding protein [Marinospirillum insulare]GLR65255.1 two-component sensor histidine kinase [Marinospirillum insulare]